MPSRRNTLLPLQLSSLDRAIESPRRRGIPIELSRLSATTAWSFPRLHSPIDGETAARLTMNSNPCGPMAVPVPCVRLDERLLRIHHAQELDAPWNGLIDEVVLLANEAIPGLEDEVEARLHLRATLAPFAATLAGVSVQAIELFENDCSRDHQYVLHCAYPQARDALRPLIERQLQPEEVLIEEDTGGHGGLFVENDHGGLWLHAHPDDPALSVLAIAQVD